MALKARIKSIGVSVPEKVLTNFDLEKTIDTSDEWIRTRTGIIERHIVDKDSKQNASDLGAEASLKAMKQANVAPEDIDCIICGTFTPDFAFPSTACVIQDKIGAKNATAFDITAACSGFLYGLTMADSLICSGKHSNILVVGSEIISRVVDWKDRNTCVLFGDGAGAAVVSASEGERGILATYTKSDGALGEILYLPAWGENRYMKMNGGEVFKNAVRMMGDSALRVLKLSGCSAEDVDCLVTHQANTRIIQTTAKYLNIPMDKVVVNLDKYGNTSSASIPLALNDAILQNRIKEGDLVVMVAFGGGLTWGAAAVRW